MNKLMHQIQKNLINAWFMSSKILFSGRNNNIYNLIRRKTPWANSTLSDVLTPTPLLLSNYINCQHLKTWDTSTLFSIGRFLKCAISHNKSFPLTSELCFAAAAKHAKFFLSLVSVMQYGRPPPDSHHALVTLSSLG